MANCHAAGSDIDGAELTEFRIEAGTRISTVLSRAPAGMQIGDTASTFELISFLVSDVHIKLVAGRNRVTLETHKVEQANQMQDKQDADQNNHADNQRGLVRVSLQFSEGELSYTAEDIYCGRIRAANIQDI
jgi:hypothetical protein